MGHTNGCTKSGLACPHSSFNAELQWVLVIPDYGK